MLAAFTEQFVKAQVGASTMFDSFNHKKKTKILVLLTILIGAFNVAIADQNNQILTRNLTWHNQTNGSCEKSEESEFPEDLFTETQRKHGAIILHAIFFLYCFGTIAIICTDYFLPTISCICEDLKFSDDVAAATFMSIATSAPELFSNIIGTFITESDIGFGHVLGNAYYDMFFVAFLGGVVACGEVVLEWWPIARDCAIYVVVALALTGIIWDGVVQFHETIILLLLYVLYFFIMFNNQKIKALVSKCIGIHDDKQQTPEVVRTIPPNRENGKEKKIESEETEPLENEQEFTVSPQIIQVPKEKNKCWILIKKIIPMPIKILLRFTIPDVRIQKLRKFYPIAFIICVAWIGISTYFGTWMISVIGETVGVPQLVMGMVFMAAGGSVVEAYAVYYKARKGECSIGLSNSMGCNTLDVTMCMALPWLVKTLLPADLVCSHSSSGVVFKSSLLKYNCLLLVISVILLFITFYINKFRLNKRLAFVCGSLYVAVLIVAITLESYSTSD